MEALREGKSLPLGGGRRKAVLAALLLHANEPVRAERLIDEIWGDSPPSQNTVHVHVSQLRKQLGDALRHDPSGYVLQVDADALDVQRFQRLVDQARGSEPVRAIELLDEALALWSGRALADAEVDGQAASEQARLEELRLAALEARVDGLLAVGRHAELVAELESLVAEHPLRERLRGQLMLTLYRCGRQAEALDSYRSARNALQEELGIEPGPELRQLERAILVQAAGLDAPGREQTRLPTPPTPLVGRARELDEVVALVRGGARLVTLTGPGGIGKTRLALEVARSLAVDAVFVALTSVADPADVATAVCKALDIDPAPDSPDADALVRHLVDRSVVLVLDNFEQLIDAAPLLSRVLEAAPGVTMVVTSRTVLRVAGEQEYPMPPLDESAGIELFVQRARAVDPAFTPAGDNEEAVRAICERLEGLPLAIELAAARSKLLQPAKLLQRLESRLAVLTAGKRDAPERQRTMRAAIEWSYRLLDSDEQLLFARLSVFVGGATLEAIEAVCGEDVATLDALASLNDKSLLRRRDEGEQRFTMLETLREYAVEQLRAMGEHDAVGVRHAAYYRELATSADAELASPGATEWLQRLERELPNIRAALTLSIAARDEPTAITIAAALRRFWEVHGHLAEGRRWLESALALDGPATGERSKAWNGLGVILGEQGDFPAAKNAFERALADARAANDDERVAGALLNLATVAHYAGDYDEAERRYAEVLPLQERTGSHHNRLITIHNSGCTAFLRGDLDTALARFEESEPLARELDQGWLLASVLRWRSWLLISRGAAEEAPPLLAESLDLVLAHGHAKGLAETYETTAAVLLARGDTAGAATLFGAAEAVHAEVGARSPDLDGLVLEVEQELRERLGDAFAAAVGAGRALPPADAVEVCRGFVGNK